MITRLYFRIYLAVLASLVVFAFAVSFAWHRFGDTGSRWQNAHMLMQFAQNILPPASASAVEQQSAVERIGQGLAVNIALFDKDLAPLAGVGDPLPPPNAERARVEAIFRFRGPPTWTFHLPDGRWLVARPDPSEHRRQPLGGLAFAGALLLLLVVVGIAAHPVARRVTRRLERLQRGVESLGRGNLAARVEVEGHDEVAALATSFNRAAARIEELVSAHRLLLANASHELRTPLTRIRIAVELLNADIDAERRAALEQDIKELDHLIDSILLASRLDALTEPAVKDEVDLLALAAEECVHYPGIDVSGESILLQGDPILLRRLIRNLVENAIRHGKPPVKVSVRSEEGHATLRVADHGSGVAGNATEAMFEPFFRVPGSATGGTGLGLALVRRIARHHGGEARIECNGPAGLTIQVRL